MKKITISIFFGIMMSSCSSINKSYFGFSEKKIELPNTKKIEVEVKKIEEQESKFIPEVDIINLKTNIIVNEAPKNKDIKIDNEKVVAISDKVIKNRVAYNKNSEKPFTGMFVLKIGTHLQYTEEYVDGVLSGTKVWYSEAGRIGMVEEYKNGILDGVKKSYYRDNGSLKVQIPYIKGVISGEMISYSKNGNVISKEKFNDGTGEWRVYWNNGKIKEEGRYEKGKKDGEWKIYNIDGKLEKKSIYKSGKIESNKWF